MKIFFVLILLSLFSCTTVHEPLQGLCYTDERGTYVCLAQTKEVLVCSDIIDEDLYSMCREEQWNKKNG